MTNRSDVKGEIEQITFLVGKMNVAPLEHRYLDDLSFAANARISSSIDDVNNSLVLLTEAVLKALEVPDHDAVLLLIKILADIRGAIIELSDAPLDAVGGDRFINLQRDCDLALDFAHNADFYFSADIIDSAPELPGVRPAPIQVAVEDNVLKLVHSQNRSGSIDYPSANRIRQSLRDTLQDVLNEIPKTTNTDVRFIKLCSSLLDDLSQQIEEISIEALGLKYQLVSKMTKRLTDEMGGVVLDELDHVLTGIGVLLNQFQEWRTYLDELAKTQLNPEDSVGLVSYGKELIKEFESANAPVDQKITKRLREMIDPVLSGAIDADAIAIPLVCSLSNIFSAFSNVAIDHISNAVSGLSTDNKLGGSILLLSFSVNVIRRFCPTLSNFQPLNFLIGVAAFITKHYSPGKDLISK